MANDTTNQDYSTRNFRTVETPPAPALDAARKWRAEHAAHVNRITANETHSYPPSGSDARNPTLWKAAHWKWLDDVDNG